VLVERLASMRTQGASAIADVPALQRPIHQPRPMEAD
jgi:hypothetical protein